jgi:glucose/arabinose dehydrogenase
LKQVAVLVSRVLTMRTPLLAIGAAVGTVFLAAAVCRADDARTSAAARAVGIERRTPWTTSKIRGAPDPPAPYRTVRVFEKLQFEEPLDLAIAPGTDRLFVAERYGKIYSFRDDPRVERADLFLDLDKVIYGIAFHPKFAENGYVYVTYITHPKDELPDGTHVSRFQVRRDDPLHCEPDTEQLLLTWPSGGHNGGCLQFGPDGCLYIATGDAGEIADPHENGQDLSTLPGSILRIDVDRRDANMAYAIPADNPFVGVAGARPEVWAYGRSVDWQCRAGPVGNDLPY